MLKSSSRIDSSLFHGAACDARPKARRMNSNLTFPGGMLRREGHYGTRSRGIAELGLC